MRTTAQLFVLAYLHDKMTEWVNGEWATPVANQVQITQELQTYDKLCMEIFEGVMLVCESGHEKDMFDQFHGVLDHIHILLVQVTTSTSDTWRQRYAQPILCRQREGSPTVPQHLQ